MIGCYVNTEKISYVAFQKMFGKSVGFRSPGKFMERLRTKAENAGGYVNEFPTYNTKLSQYCHKCGKYTKKPLSQRVHRCCGLNIQRDIYSAFLALNIKGNDLDVSAVKYRWLSMETMLRSASTPSGDKAVSESATHSPRRKASERFGQEVLRNQNKVKDVVTDGEQLLLFPL